MIGMDCAVRLSRHLGVVAAVTGVLAASPASAQLVGIGTNPQGTMAYSAAAAIAKHANDAFGMQARIQPSAGPTVYMPQINAGELETGIVTIVSIHEYLQRAEFGGKKEHDIRLAAIMFPLRLGLFVRKASDVKTIHDLRGKRVAGEFRSQMNSQWMAEALLASAGLTYNDVLTVPAPHVARGADDFGSGRVDATIFSLGTSKVAELNAAVGGVRFLSVADTAATKAAFEKHAPGTYLSRVVPSPVLVGINEPTNVIATDLTLIAGAKAADEVIYKIVKSMHDHRASLAAAVPAFKELAPEAMAKKAAFDYHPGAIRFYREIGQWPPKG